MSCDVVEPQETIERYLLDQLSEVEREDFERHYFACESCLALLQTSLALQTELQLQPRPLPSAGPALRGFWSWAPAFAVLLIVIGLGVWWSRAQQRPPSSAALPYGGEPGPAVLASPSPSVPQLEQLARVEPPPYIAVTLRGPEDGAQEQFRRAMQSYVRGDYENSIGGLRAAAVASPSTPAFSFYLGACYLLTHRVEDAVDVLKKTVSLGDTPFLEPSHFLLAKSHLAEGRVAEAMEEFQATVRLRGNHEAEARDILGQLQK